MIDLHVHSTASDGTFTPSELVEYAITHGISAFALTDHDSVNGLEEAISYAKELSGVVCEKNPEGNELEVIPGIEFSTEYEGKDIHIVGLYVDYKNPAFVKPLVSFIESRNTRNQKMCALLREHGIDITYEALQAENPGAVITRAHYGKYLLENGYVGSMNEAFDRYIGDHAPCFLPREKVTPESAIKLILEAGGVPVLAHPVLYRMSDRRLDALVAQLKEAGLMGIEVIYSTYNTAETRDMQALADKYDLLVSGGSDFHGANKKDLNFGTGYGKLYLHEDILEKIKAAL